MKNLILKHFYKLIGDTQKDHIRVLIFHDIEKENFNKFEILLNSILKNCNVISPEEFKMSINGKYRKKNDKKKILITFDDGYKSQKKITEKYLNPLNIKALFFLVSEFVNCTSKEDAHNFVRNNFYKEKYMHNLDNNLENMNIEDINFLINSGHTLGAHTKTHPQLSKIKNKKELISQIIDCKKNLENLSNKIKINDFAYTFGDCDSINKSALSCISENYTYIYSGLRGNNLDIKKNIVRRDAVNLWEPLEVINCYLNGYLDFIYKRKINTLEKWI